VNAFGWPTRASTPHRTKPIESPRSSVAMRPSGLALFCVIACLSAGLGSFAALHQPAPRRFL
jgi:hypothetical protein